MKELSFKWEKISKNRPFEDQAIALTHYTTTPPILLRRKHSSLFRYIADKLTQKKITRYHYFLVQYQQQSHQWVAALDNSFLDPSLNPSKEITLVYYPILDSDEWTYIETEYLGCPPDFKSLED